ncbi:CehA/McbA family metallohydrolase [Mongoliimonas terrestris]|uniref:CehA/McbA family metallohydrolase n=1 Tax=Mongoliimonas terrestris TaxID=1709001 RepID=UPI0009499F45|nr:CehA/McbA family metallohydrolase [Mongoliimonas terrestris]
MPFAVFDKPGRFLRGNLHTHSTRSDGALAPEEVSRRYKAMGYDFYCLSDHFLKDYGFPITDTREHRAEGFTTLIGAEIHAGLTSQDEIWHILAVGLPFDFAPTADDETGPALARRAAEAGAFVAIAHPQWYGLTLADAEALDAAHAVEIYNHGCAVHSDRPDGTALLDALLSTGRHATAIATDDAHFKDTAEENADAFGGWVMVKAEENAPDAILAALKAGDFYASQGPELRHVAVDGDDIVIRSSAVEKVILLGPGARSRVVSGHAMTEARLSLAGFSGGWIRIVAVDAAGRRAWSNPARL